MRELTQKEVTALRVDFEDIHDTWIKYAHSLSDWDLWCVVSGLAYPGAPGPLQEDSAALFFTNHLRRGGDVAQPVADAWEREAIKCAAGLATTVQRAHYSAVLRRAYRAQRRNATRRSIPWGFDYATWLSFWVSSGHLHERGVKGDGYVMSRFKDEGAYTPDNCEVIRCSENVRQLQVLAKRGRTIAARPKDWKPKDDHKHLRRGANPRGKRVLCPDGVEYPSAAAAAEVHNMTRAAIAQRCRTGWGGWHFKNDSRGKPQ